MSKIEWTDETWNPTTGCSKVSAGCANCYMFREWPRLAGNPKTDYYGREPTDVQTHDKRLDQPLRWKKPRMIFVNSMSDLFHEDIPFKFVDKVFAAMALTPHHTYQVLTKRPERMVEYLSQVTLERMALSVPKAMWKISKQIANAAILGNKTLKRKRCSWPLPNVWLGVSVEDQKTADERIPLLLSTPVAIRFVSYEPALGPISIEPYMPNKLWNDLETWRQPELSWIIVGGESGPKARPSHSDWFRSVRDQCKVSGVPFFMKQMTKKAEIPQDLLIREYPMLGKQ